MLAMVLAVILLCVNDCGNAESSEDLAFRLNDDGKCWLYGASLC